MRLPVLLAAAILGAGYLCGDATARTRYIPTVDNPYCSITTYLIPHLPEQAISSLDAEAHPVIAVNAETVHDQTLFSHFLMAHECCHHSLGHVTTYHHQLGHMGPQPFFYVSGSLKRLELEADCCAIKMLKSRNETDVIVAARTVMAGFGNAPTGAYYPTGIERADNITACAADN